MLQSANLLLPNLMDFGQRFAEMSTDEDCADFEPTWYNYRRRPTSAKEVKYSPVSRITQEIGKW